LCNTSAATDPILTNEIGCQIRAQIWPFLTFSFKYNWIPHIGDKVRHAGQKRCNARKLASNMAIIR
jgi:hypothetical protein